jgi:hypothetical protein
VRAAARHHMQVLTPKERLIYGGTKMTSFLSGSANIGRIPLYFHRVKEEETMESIATKYNVDMQQILNDNAGTEVRSGEIIVIDLRKSGIF